MQRYRAEAFGCVWDSDIALPNFAPADDAPRLADICVRGVAALTPRDIIQPLNRGGLCSDGVRLRWEREVVMDMFDGTRIDYCPGPDWRGRLPASFFSSMAALVMAWRQALPLHACAVEIDGYAILITGESGAGKSTLAAGLVAQGACFLADDLVVARQDGDKRLMIELGRPAVRLHPETAGWVPHIRTEPAIDDPRGKILATMPQATNRAPVPLGAVLMLSDNDIPPEFVTRWALLAAQQFRPAWMSTLPHQAHREQILLMMAKSVPLVQVAPIKAYDAQAFAARGQAAMLTIRKLLAAPLSLV